jgi:hypothetical protein
MENNTNRPYQVKEGISEIEGKLEKLLCSDDNKEKNKLS